MPSAGKSKALEYIRVVFSEAATQLLKEGRQLFVVDRGLMDGAAYWSQTITP